MPRRREVPKRSPLPDPLYNSSLVSSFVNVVMKRGKKSTAEGVVYRAFDKIRERTSEDPLKVFKKAIDNIKPTLEVKSRRVGGSNYQVPVEVRPERRTSLSLRWLVTYARERPEKTMVEKLANEILDASQNRGGSVKKREDTHRMAEANKAFAHYRW
jgi:small subunit ribosomal protein S7